MKQVLEFILMIVAVLGIIGSAGYVIYCGAWPLAVGLAAAFVLAWPRIVEIWNALILRYSEK